MQEAEGWRFKLQIILTGGHSNKDGWGLLDLRISGFCRDTFVIPFNWRNNSIFLFSVVNNVLTPATCGWLVLHPHRVSKNDAAPSFLSPFRHLTHFFCHVLKLLKFWNIWWHWPIIARESENIRDETYFLAFLATTQTVATHCPK
jgi:hypothetical protein